MEALEKKKPNGSDIAAALLKPAEQPLLLKPVLSAQDHALETMRKPFAPNQISKMCKSTKKDNPPGKCKDCGGFHKLPSVQLSYVGHAALTDRLLDADPKWTWEPLALAPDGSPLLDSNGGMWIKLTVAGVTRLGYGDAQGKSGGDAMKERIGDALRNAAMRFGAALELWHKGELHVDETKAEDETQAVPEGLGDERYVLLLTNIEGSNTVEELRIAHSVANKEASEAKDVKAIASLAAAKNKRYREIANVNTAR
jgi:hypothetical protein